MKRRAVSAVLPLLKSADEVIALAVGEGESASGYAEPGVELALWLAHGVKVTVRRDAALKAMSGP